MVFIIKELDSSALPVLQAVSWLHRYCCSSRCQEAMYLSGTIWRFPKEAEQFIAFLEIQVTEDHAKVNTLADLIMASLFFFKVIKPKEVAAHVLAQIFPFQSSPASEDVKCMASFGLWN